MRRRCRSRPLRRPDLYSAIADQSVGLAEIAAGCDQETHPEMLFKACSHCCERISGADQMPRTPEMAIREAVGKPASQVRNRPSTEALS